MVCCRLPGLLRRERLRKGTIACGMWVTYVHISHSPSYTLMFIHTHTHTNTHTHTLSLSHTHYLSLIHTYIHSYSHTHTHTHTYIHSHTHHTHKDHTRNRYVKPCTSSMVIGMRVRSNVSDRVRFWWSMWDITMRLGWD